MPFLFSALAALALAASAAPAPAATSLDDAAAEALSAETRGCLDCHDQEGLSKRFGQDDERSLRVDARAFAASAHGPLGCIGCHAEVDLRQHPGDDRAAASKFASFGDFARAQARGCRSCHEPIADAWATSAHGRAEGAGPNCATCHRAHEVRPTMSGAGVREVCLGCHQDAVGAHEAWLPNTKLHLQAVACAACHSPDSGKNIELRLFDPASRRLVSTPASPAALAQVAGSEAPIDAHRLSRLLRGLDEEAPGKLMLRGSIQVRSPADSHRLHEKGKALRDCAACHSKNAAAFREVRLSLIGPDGRRVHFEAQPEVLHNPRSLDSLRGFYAIGGTRIGLLDTLLALALLAGLGAPLLHLVLRRTLRTTPTPPRDARTGPPSSNKEST